MNIILFIIFILLIIMIKKKQTYKLLINLFINFLLLLISFYFIYLGLNPIIIAIIYSLIVTYNILKNINSKYSYTSIIIVFIIISIIIFIFSFLNKLNGFGTESFEDISMFSLDININYMHINIALTLISLIGALIDTSVAISSPLREIYLNKKNIKEKELYQSGLNIGKDIIGTTNNTLIFAFLGEFITLLIWYTLDNYHFTDIINSKSFNIEYFKIIITSISCIMVIPITAKIITNKIIKD